MSNKITLFCLQPCRLVIMHNRWQMALGPTAEKLELQTESIAFHVRMGCNRNSDGR
jgi:hypothetical protein